MKKAIIRFFDKDLNFIGEVEKYTSFFYVRKWNSHGEFEIHVSNMDKYLFQKGNFIVVNNDKYRSGIIEHIEANEEETSDIVIKGYSLLYLTSHRVTVPPTGYDYHSFNTQIENIMLGLVNSNVINSVEAKRNIINLHSESSKNRGEKLNFQTRYKNLEEELIKLSNSSGLGIEIALDFRNKKLVFEILEGKDLSYKANGTPYVVFSKKYDNIMKRNYIESNIGYKNVGYVAGQGEGANRELAIVNDELVGIDRREIFIDARDIGEGESLSLTDRGKIKLDENRQITSFECEVSTKEYMKNWNLGDVVTVKDDETGIIQHHRITEVKEIYEIGGFKVEPTFGNNIPTIGEKIKQQNDEPIAENTPGPQGDRGPQGTQGYSLNYNWSGSNLGIKREDEGSYKYENLIGPQGIAGPKGDKGDKGDIGPIGQQGIQGPKGNTGERGPQGPIGVQGPAGNGQSYIVFQECFISSLGQKLFTWNDGYVYPVGINAISVYLNGVRLSNRIFNEINGNSIEFKVGLNEGDRVFIEGMQAVVDLQGPKGDVGERGPQGIQGAQGIKGDTGPMGPQGQVGAKGDKGLTGDIGPQGAQGVQGPKGDVGLTGAQGIQGPKGDKGDIGLIGPKGDTGNVGPKGDKGVTGDNGITPTIGSNSNWYLGNSDTGKPSRGIQGPKGDKGDTGSQGVPGPAGSTQSYIVFHQHFIATEGQTVFEWNDGYIYHVGVNAISVYLNGVRLSNRIINQLRGNAIQFKVGLKDGDKVFIEAFQMVVDLQGPKGDKGDKGATGTQGAIGPKGDKGDTGLIGTQGPKGDKGDIGLTGQQGIQGPKGDVGAKGDTGATGAQGVKGDTGERGPQGPIGPQGSTGSNGFTWRPVIDANGNLSWTNNGSTSTPSSINIRGPKGDIGAIGPQGAKGDKGDTGIQGPVGAKGDKGLTGDKGPQGAQGVQGPKGDVGLTGAQGPKGATGSTGAQGPAGKDGTQIVTSSSRPSSQVNGRVWIQLI